MKGHFVSKEEELSTDAKSMSAIVDEMFAAFGRGDRDAFVASLAPNAVYEETSDMAPITGRSAFGAYASAWMDCSSNRRLTPTKILHSGDEVVVELRYEGTHDGDDIYGVKATGKQMRFDAALKLWFEGDRIQRLKAFYNPLQLMQQIGATAHQVRQP